MQKQNNLLQLMRIYRNPIQIERDGSIESKIPVKLRFILNQP